MAKVVVTGGAGFIGGHVVEKLAKAGHEVTVYDKMVPKFKLPDSCTHVFGDVFDSAHLKLVMRNADFVFHLAAMSNTMDCVKFPEEAVALNCLGTAKVLNAAYEVGREMPGQTKSVNRPGTPKGMPRVIVASSILISGIMPDIANDDNLVDVSKSYHLYVSTKLYQEMLARDFNRMYGLPYTVLRYGICYGPRMTPGVVADVFIRKALKGEPLTLDGGGEQWRQYLYVEDLAEAHVAVLAPEAENQTYNVTKMEKVRIIDMAEAIRAEIPGTDVVVTPARSHDIDVDLLTDTKIREELGWEAKTSLQEGIRKTIAWYKERGF